MRAFIAIEIPDAVRESMGALRDQWRDSGVRAAWVRPENMHLTLRFLGEVSHDQVARLRETLDTAYAAMPALCLAIRGAGAFPNPRRPSVLWVGVHALSGDLAAAQQCAEDAARGIGLAADNKAFHPHITLARIRDARQAGPVQELVAAAADFDGGAFAVETVSLFESELRPSGPLYRRLREFRLS